MAGTYSASHCVNPVSRSPSGGMEEGGTGVREGAALHPQKQWLELHAQNGPHAQSKPTLPRLLTGRRQFDTLIPGEIRPEAFSGVVIWEIPVKTT